MTVKEFCSVISEASRLRIRRGKEDLYVGYLGVMKTDGEIYRRIQDAEVKHFAADPELRHREWRQRELMPPLLPSETPDYSFSDLQMTLYYTITI